MKNKYGKQRAADPYEYFKWSTVSPTRQEEGETKY